MGTVKTQSPILARRELGSTANVLRIVLWAQTWKKKVGQRATRGTVKKRSYLIPSSGRRLKLANRRRSSANEFSGRYPGISRRGMHPPGGGAFPPFMDWQITNCVVQWEVHLQRSWAIKERAELLKVVQPLQASTSGENEGRVLPSSPTDIFQAAAQYLQSGSDGTPRCMSTTQVYSFIRSYLRGKLKGEGRRRYG